MKDIQIIWDDEDDPNGNFQHIVNGHDVTVEEVEEVLHDRKSRDTYSRSTDNPMTFGMTSTGKKIAIVWEEICDDPRMIRPITAFLV